MPDVQQPDPACPRCKTALPASSCNTANLAVCGACGAKLQVAVFPAFLRRAGQNGQTPAAAQEGEASCYHHPAKQAVIACEACGRFLCALCHVRLGNMDLCPSCITISRSKGKLPNLDRHRVLHDNIVMALAVYPLVIPFFGWILTPVTSVTTLVLAIRHWKSPLSFEHRTRARFVFGAILALLQIAAWAVLAIVLAANLKS